MCNLIKTVILFSLFSNFAEVSLGMELESSFKLQVASRALVINENKLLLVSNDQKLWYTPGGRLENGETLHEAIIREVKEETGLDVTPKRLTSVFEFFDVSNLLHKVELYFLCDIVSGELSGEWVDRGGPVKFSNFFTIEELRGLEQVQPIFLKDGNWATQGLDIYKGFEKK